MTVLLNILQLQTFAQNTTVAVTRTQTVTRRDCSSTAPVTAITKETDTPVSPSTGGRGSDIFSVLDSCRVFSLLYHRRFYRCDISLLSVCFPGVLKTTVAAVNLLPASSLVQWVKTSVHLFSSLCLTMLSGLRVTTICVFFFFSFFLFSSKHITWFNLITQ